MTGAPSVLHRLIDIENRMKISLITFVSGTALIAALTFFTYF